MTGGGRLRRLVGAALADSFGLSLGWTVFSLHVVRAEGLAGLGLCNAAMLVGVALSAPVAARLSCHLDGRALLRTTAVTEAALRVGTFALLLAGAPLPVVALAVVTSNVAAWTGYAGMRAEVAATDPRGAAMTWYMVAVAAIEAAGSATAALLPTGPDRLVSGGLLFAVIAGYGACLLPTWLVASGAVVPRTPAPTPSERGRVAAWSPRKGEQEGRWGLGGSERDEQPRRGLGGAGHRGEQPGRRGLGVPGRWDLGGRGRGDRPGRWGLERTVQQAGPPGRLVGATRTAAPAGSPAPLPGFPTPPAGSPTGLLATGGLVMLLGSGPTLLAVGLAAQLHGTRWVAGSALAFALGSLLAPLSVARLERHALPPTVAWPALGVGMVAGWSVAAWHPAGLLAAQLLSGMCMSALEGDMDARVAAAGGSRRGVTAGLASAAALRAFGSATAVALAPRVIANSGVGALSVALVTILLIAMVLTLARHRSQWSLSGTGPTAHPG